MRETQPAVAANAPGISCAASQQQNLAYRSKEPRRGRCLTTHPKHPLRVSATISPSPRSYRVRLPNAPISRRDMIQIWQFFGFSYNRNASARMGAVQFFPRSELYKTKIHAVLMRFDES